MIEEGWEKNQRSLHQRQREKLQLTGLDVGNAAGERTDTRICTGVLLSRPYQSCQELDRQEKSKNSWEIPKSKGFESWIREWSSFSTCFKFIVTNEEVDSCLNEHAGPEGSLDISITFRNGYQGTIFKLTLSLSSTYKWAIRREMLGPLRLTELAVWAPRPQGPFCPSDWWELLQAELTVPESVPPAGRFFCFVDDVGCGQSFSVGLWIQDLQVHLLSNI